MSDELNQTLVEGRSGMTKPQARGLYSLTAGWVTKLNISPSPHPQIFCQTKKILNICGAATTNDAGVANVRLHDFTCIETGSHDPSIMTLPAFS